MSVIEENARFIFLAALERAPDQWPTFLDQGCGDNAELRARVDELLGAHEALGTIDGCSAMRETRPPMKPRKPKARAPSLGHISCSSKSAKAAWAWCSWRNNSRPFVAVNV